MNKSIAVIGLGYIGLPLALSFCEKGYQVYGVEVDELKVANLKCGITNVHEMHEFEPLESVLRRHLSTGQFIPTTRILDVAGQVGSYVITVGIPVGANGAMNELPLEQAIQGVAKVIRRADLVLVRSTLVPGMMNRKIIPLLSEYTGMKPGVDFHVAYASERVAEGRAMKEFQTLDIVLGALTDECSQRAKQLLEALTVGTIHETNLFIAEATKVVENVQRDVNIALVQELAIYAEQNGIDVYELIRMANTHPRVSLLEPGIGVGGFCIPNAFHYLNQSFDNDLSLPLLELARDINSATPHRLVRKIESGLKPHGLTIQGSTIALLGLGMKDFSNDIRLSPAVDLARQLISRGAVVRAYDPTVVSHSLPYQVDSLDACLCGAQVVVVGAWQTEFEKPWFRQTVLDSTSVCTILDLKNRLRMEESSEFARYATLKREV